MAATWPTAADLLLFLQAAGLVTDTLTEAQDLLELDTAIEAARAEFEQRTHWEPFLAATQTRKYDAPLGTNLILDAGLLTCTSVSVAGALLVADIDYWLAPANAALRGRPYTRVEFRSMPVCDPQQIVIVGSWGRFAALPPEARLAVLGGAARRLAPQLGAAVSRGVVMWREGDVQEQYGPEPFGGLAAAWQKLMERGVATYTRQRIG